MLPIAHLGHWLWIFYVIPILIVVAGIFYSTRADRRRGDAGREDEPPEESEDEVDWLAPEEEREPGERR